MRRAVVNLDRAIAFYVGALGFGVDHSASNISESRSAHLTLGTESIDLFSPDAWAESLNSKNINGTVNNTAFQHIAIVTQDMDQSISQLRRFDPQFISDDAAVRLPLGAGGVTACKFLDPDGHPLELISFPPNAGNPKWHRIIEGGPNLGIDHSAMSVSDINKSISFYVDSLGFRITSRHLNEGQEQARLDGVNESVVDVVALGPPIQSTPHLELLGYRVPVVQQRKISTSICEDHADQLIFFVDDVAAVSTNLRIVYANYEFHSSKLESGALLIRDFDGHVLRLQA